AINETIIYDFGTESRHGIYREIPLVSPNGPKLDIKVLSVSDINGIAYRFSTSISKDILNIKIGDPDMLVSGVQTYVISYQILNTIRYFDDHDEFFWNVTGNGWEIPIEKATASVWFQPFPKDSVLAAEFKSACFTGATGSKETDCVSYADSTNSDIFHFSTNSSLDVGEGLTIALNFPKELVNIVGSTDNSNSLSTGNSSDSTGFVRISVIIIILGILLSKKILFMINPARARRTIAKIPKELKNKAIVTEYNPPADLFPIDIGTLFDRTVDMQDISSVILHLAIRGYLKINYITEKRRFWFSKKDFELIKIKEGNDLTHPADKIIFELLFDGRDSVTLSYLKTRTMTLQSDMGKIKEKVKDRLVNEKYFDSVSMEKSTKLKTYAGVVLTVFLCVALLRKFIHVIQIPEGIFYGLSGLLGFVFLIWFLVLIFKSQKLSDKLSEKGISALEKILGFQEFLSMTEKDRLDFHNAPEKNPEQFTEYLPYAMVLGIEKKWAQKFEGMYIPQPDWYQGNIGGTFLAVDFVSHMAIFSSSFIAMSVPKNTQSSGFGGGGSSGGGGGGGGGGSW
nr:DUF2207 domain-containing protein [Candidatus Paceibacterota bacterium]